MRSTVSKTPQPAPLAFSSIAFNLSPQADKYHTYKWMLYLWSPNTLFDLSVAISKVVFHFVVCQVSCFHYCCLGGKELTRTHPWLLTALTLMPLSIICSCCGAITAHFSFRQLGVNLYTHLLTHHAILSKRRIQSPFPSLASCSFHDNYCLNWHTLVMLTSTIFSRQRKCTNNRVSLQSLHECCMNAGWLLWLNTFVTVVN